LCRRQKEFDFLWLMLIGLGGLVEFERELTRTRHRADRD
jgi:hypothetical protein